MVNQLIVLIFFNVYHLVQALTMAIEKTLLLTFLKWLYSHLSLLDIVLAVLGFFIFSCFFQKLTNKGPMLWPVFGITPSMFLHVNTLYDWISETLIKAGGNFHYRGVWMGGAYGICTADSSNIEYMVKTNFKNFPKGNYYRERFRDLLGDGIFNSDGEFWKQQRQMAKTQMHTGRFMDYSLQTVQDLVHQKLLKVMEKMVESGDRFDLQEILLRFTLDNICTAGLGWDPGCSDIDLPEVPFAKAFEEATEFTLFRFMIPPFVWKPIKFLKLGYERRLQEVIKIVHDFAENIVVERRNKLKKFGNLNDQSDLLSRIMESEIVKQVNYRNIPDKFYVDFCISFILAGRDTTSVGLAWFFWLINKNPDVETRILIEINGILAERKVKSQNDIVFTMEELKKMVYLHAALSESLRLYPSVPIEIKEVLNDDVLPNGMLTKKGARIFYCIYAMGRMESIWGKDCLEFKPERWIKDGEFVSENQFKYAVFNAGPRLCIGKKFAYMQMKMVAASILLRYSVKVVEGHAIVPKVTTTLYMKNGLLVTLHPRLPEGA